MDLLFVAVQSFRSPPQPHAVQCTVFDYFGNCSPWFVFGIFLGLLSYAIVLGRCTSWTYLDICGMSARRAPVPSAQRLCSSSTRSLTSVAVGRDGVHVGCVAHIVVTDMVFIRRTDQHYHTIR